MSGKPGTSRRKNYRNKKRKGSGTNGRKERLALKVTRLDSDVCRLEKELSEAKNEKRILQLTVKRR